MKTLLLIAALLSSVFSCHDNKPSENEFALYVNLYSDTRDWITVSFDGRELYNGEYKTGHRKWTQMMFIANLPKDTLEHDFRLQMINVDTTLRISLKGIDSLMIVPNSIPSFSYVDQDRSTAWKYD
jgi:hypothetical protein